MRAVLYGFSFPHHSGRNAFHSLAAALRPECRVVDATNRLLRHLPPSLARRVSYRWYRYNEYRLRLRYLRSRTTVFHYFFPENTLFKAADWKNGHKLVVTCHQPPGVLAERIGRPGYAPFFRGLRAADAVVLLTGTQVEGYRSILPELRYEVIPHGIDVDFFTPPASGGEPGEAPVVLTVGSWLRDYQTWASVVRRVIEQRPEVQFRVVANPSSLDEARRALGGQPPQVALLTGVPDEALRAEYARASVVYLPLHDAMANNAVLEAMAMARPVVVTDLPATREYLGPDAARYVRNEHPGDTADLLAGLIDRPEERASMGAAGRRKVNESLAWDVVAARYLQLYEELLATP